jgi:hypothetical protein
VPQNDAALQDMTAQSEQAQDECASAPPKN